MFRMLQAHGLDAGPTQRPLLAGASAGVIATAPALVVLAGFQTLDAPARITGLSSFTAAIAYVGLMLVGGVLYGSLFQRAANDRRGGWLFGLAFGFVLWMLGPVPLLQWLPEQPIMRGYPAAGLLLAQLLWGLSLGVVFPFIHRRLHVDIDNQPGSAPRATGPEAAAQSRMLRTRSSENRRPAQTHGGLNDDARDRLIQRPGIGSP